MTSVGRIETSSFCPVFAKKVIYVLTRLELTFSTANLTEGFFGWKYSLQLPTPTKDGRIRLMNDFPVIGDLVMRRGLWDRQGTGQTLQVTKKKCKGWSCFSVKNSVFGHRMSHFAVTL